MIEALQARKYDVLKQTFGFDSFRPGQEPVIDALLAGQSVLAVMPTGAGKSLCYQVPALTLDGLTVVVSPLVALMEDQVAALRLSAVAAEAIHSGKERPDNVAAWKRITAGESRLLYLSPERLMTPPMLKALAQRTLSLIAIDEAHCLSQWGPAFRPDYAELTRLPDLFPGTPIAAMTATADDGTRRDIETSLFKSGGKTFVSGFDRPNISLTVAAKASWKDQLATFVQARAGQSGIVYCLSRAKTEEAATHLCGLGLNAVAYHAGLDKRDRAERQDRFITEPGLVMVATIAFGMGIDKPDVRFVFHTDIPASTEAYYQEIGRAGRDGAPADAHMLYGLGDMAQRRRFIEQEDTEPGHKRREHKRLDSLITYCESPTCRRQVLLSYFGESSAPCGNCDVCLNPVELADGTIDGQMALSAVARTGELFGPAHIVDVLRGSNTEKIRRFGHDRLPTFGKGEAHSRQAWQSILRQLVAAGFLHVDVNNHGGLHITQDGRALLGGDRTFHYRPDLVAAGKSKTRKTSTPVPTDLSTEDQFLLTALKKKRLEIAKARDVPAFVVFSDRTLNDMASRRPVSREDFAAVHGVGAAKLKDFANPFLQVIADFQDGALETSPAQN